MNDMIQLYKEYNNIGKITYFCTLLSAYVFVFVIIFGFSVNFLYYPTILVTGSAFAWLFQNRYCYFNSHPISIIYRILLISVVTYLLYNITFIDMERGNFIINHNPNPWMFVIVSTALVAGIAMPIATILAFPFKLFSLLLDNIDSIDELYTKEDRAPIYPESGYVGIIIEHEDIYTNYTEQQLEAALVVAMREENYKEAAIIKKHLKRFGTDDE